MGSHPVNLALRFTLEILALLSLGYWGSQQGSGVISIVMAIGIPIVAAVAWGTFAVPNDPSRSDDAPVVIPGWARLLLELTLFITATAALLHLDLTLPAIIFIMTVIVHYVASYDRVKWLLQQ